MTLQSLHHSRGDDFTTKWQRLLVNSPYNLVIDVETKEELNILPLLLGLNSWVSSP